LWTMAEPGRSQQGPWPLSRSVVIFFMCYKYTWIMNTIYNVHLSYQEIKISYDPTTKSWNLHSSKEE
jgi:hypothetical protein